MITEKKALKRAKEAYISLWGADWVREHNGTITAVYGMGPDGYHVDFYQDTPREGKEIIIGGTETRGNHETHFVFDKETEEMTVIEHY